MAVITGGSGEAGKAGGKLFAPEGARVLSVDITEEALKESTENIGDAANYFLEG